MAEQDKDQKTEAPSSKRLSEAREKGQVPLSKETSTWVMLLGTLIVVAWVLPSMTQRMGSYLSLFLEQPHAMQMSESSVQKMFFDIYVQVGMIVGLVFLLMMAATILGVMAQTGFFFALPLLAFDLTRLAPTQGFKKLFSVTALFELFKSAGKLFFLGGIAVSILMPLTSQALPLTGLPIENILAYLHHQMVHLIVILLLAFTLIAAIDLFFTRFQYAKNLRMTKTEVKDEFKQQEGDPMIKNRLRQIRTEKARKRMMAQVPKADVVITNPTHYAVALQYDNARMGAPVVVAKGVNLIAERIRELALEHRVPLVSNPPLARALHDTVEIDQQIPTQHYRTVAEVISYVYKLKGRKF